MREDRQCLVAYHSYTHTGTVTGTLQMGSPYPPTLEEWRALESRVREWCKADHRSVRSVLLRLTPLAAGDEKAGGTAP